MLRKHLLKRPLRKHLLRKHLLRKRPLRKHILRKHLLRKRPLRKHILRKRLLRKLLFATREILLMLLQSPSLLRKYTLLRSKTTSGTSYYTNPKRRQRKRDLPQKSTSPARPLGVFCIIIQGQTYPQLTYHRSLEIGLGLLTLNQVIAITTGPPPLTIMKSFRRKQNQTTRPVDAGDTISRMTFVGCSV
jgi:hypothetical protein